MRRGANTAGVPLVLNDRYELRRVPIARGGMGEVWEGHDTRLDREVAVKFVRFPDGVEDADLVRRFVRESRITARLRHPGVPAVFDAGTHEGRPYLVMQRVHGTSVSDLIAQQEQLSIGWSAAIAAQTCAVLSAAHQASLIHRDLKPGNLMLEPDGTVKVLDFGLAVGLDLVDMSRITRTGETIGTPAYMAPEQVLAAMSTPASDLYALGCTLHELLTGQQVFTGSTSYAVMNKQVDHVPPPVWETRPDVPRDLGELLAALLEKAPENRPASAHEVYQRLLPHVSALDSIPGVLHPPNLPSSTRMQATVLSRVFDAPLSARSVDPDSSKTTTSGTSRDHESREDTRPHLDRSVLARARVEAASLVRASRHHQAARLLEVTVTKAGAAFDADDPEVIALRKEWANILFEAGDYRQAAPAFGALAEDLAQRGTDNELVHRCRLQEATCHALTGDTTRALHIQRALLADEERFYGADDPRPLELRRQIGLLLLGAGHRHEAQRVLAELRADLLRIHGPDHPAIARIDPLIAGSATDEEEL